MYNEKFLFTEDEVSTIISALNNYIEHCRTLKKQPQYKYNTQISDNISLAEETIKFISAHSDLIKFSFLQITVTSLALLKNSINDILNYDNPNSSVTLQKKDLRQKINQIIRKLRPIFEYYDEDIDYFFYPELR